MDLTDFQARIEAIYGTRDRERGPALSFLWLVEEVGELSEEVRRATQELNVNTTTADRDGSRSARIRQLLAPETHERLTHEVGDVLAWLTTIASMLDVDLERAAARYATGCPSCGAVPCACEGA